MRFPLFAEMARLGAARRGPHDTRAALRRRVERNPDEHRLESLDDWILFGPRWH